MADDRIVAVGFLTEQDVRKLGARFHRLFPIADDDAFSDLVAELDRIEATPPRAGQRQAAIDSMVDRARAVTNAGRT